VPTPQFPFRHFQGSGTSPPFLCLGLFYFQARPHIDIGSKSAIPIGAMIFKTSSVIHPSKPRFLNDLYIKKFVLPALSLLVLLASNGCSKNSETNTSGAGDGDSLLIGEIAPMTGSEATFGVSTHRGIELAFEQINGSGGIKGKKLKLQTMDNQGKTDEAALAATKLITQSKVIAILAEPTSGRTLAIAPLAQRYKIPLISSSATNPRVTEVGDYIFRVCFIDPFQGPVISRFIYATKHLKNIAILTDMKSDYSVSLSEIFESHFKNQGGKIVAKQSYAAGDVDFKAQLTALRNDKPDGIFIPGYYTEVGLIARQAKELGITVPLFGGDGWDSPKLAEIAGASINGSFFANHYSADDPSPVTQQFIKDYKSRYGDIPDGMAAMGFDSAQVLAQALKRAENFSGDAIRASLASTKDHSGVTGTFSMDANRNPSKSAVMLEVQNGKFNFIAKISPKDL